MIQNPILPGFNPDPSILRVGDDYYIATSTFEWFPGIAIYHSKDLKHWQLINHALSRSSQVDLKGLAPALGVWAPALSYNKSLRKFYMCFSVIHGVVDNFFDLDNYVVTTDDINGEWSEAIYLNSSGFDPSLFHDDDGRSWLINLEWDFRKGYEHPGCIVLEGYDLKTNRLLGNPIEITRGGTDRGCLEGPFLYKRHDWYYLITAEGGTGYGHGVVVQRSRSIEGPYEIDEKKPVITSQGVDFNERGIGESMKMHWYNPDTYLQRAGHGLMVETTGGEVYMSHLCSRPLMPEQRSVLGRETAIQRCYWTEDDWIKLDSDDNLALEQVQEPALPEVTFVANPERDDFEQEILSKDYYTLREPVSKEWLRISQGKLELRGRESLLSRYNQSFIGKKLTTFKSTAQTCLIYQPENFMEMAGLTCYYNHTNFYYLRYYYSQSLGGPALGIMMADNGKKDELLDARVSITQGDAIYLKAEIDHQKLQFYYGTYEGQWLKIGPVLDMTILSDEYANGFTGAFVGLTAQDQRMKSKWATFEYFELKKYNTDNK